MRLRDICAQECDLAHEGIGGSKEPCGAFWVFPPYLEAVVAMNRTFKLTMIAGAVALLGALPVSLHGQGSAPTVDPALAKKGRAMFASKGCNGCHSVGAGKRAGPGPANQLAERLGQP